MTMTVYRSAPIYDIMNINGMQVHYRREGSGRPVVLLHGGILSLHDYDAVVPLLRGRYDVIALDRPGYGYSQREPGVAMTPARQSEWLHQVLTALRAEKPIIVGHSWSGLMTLAYALNHPGEAAGIVLLAPAAYGGKAYPAGRLDALLYRGIRSLVIGDILMRGLLMPLSRPLAALSAKGAFAPAPVPAAYMERAYDLWCRPSQIRANREDVFSFSQTAEDLSSRYPALTVPTVIAVGDKEPYRPELQSLRLHRDIPHSALLTVRGAHHMLPVTHPEAVAEALALLEERIDIGHR
ncbi:alpha/beta hydrolase [Paenibacillus dendritiformis]|nr:alpha/beta hydrolase [Paenibacillus dendritiformis]NRG00839.1 alpha/beta hydrolase [Paenibacillus dendritiformis]GIO70934.1 alpha/beta hydrolase [Paenibacillus dendritiformis]